MGIETMSCSKCGTPYKRFTSAIIDKRHREDAKKLGIHYKKGVLACPKCFKLSEGEYWIKPLP
jgi:hypothetical protein